MPSHGDHIMRSLRRDLRKGRKSRDVIVPIHLIRAYMSGVVRAFDKYRHEKEPEKSIARREYLRGFTTPDLTSFLEEFGPENAIEGTFSAVPRYSRLSSEIERLNTLGFEDGCRRLNVMKWVTLNTEFITHVEQVINEFNPDQPRDAEGKWTDTGVSTKMGGRIVRPQFHGIGNPVDKVSRNLFGRVLTDSDIQAIGFSPEGTTVTISGKGNEIFLDTKSDSATSTGIPELTASRRIYKPWFAPLTCYNLTVRTRGKYAGIGFDLFSAQVETLQKLGVKRIVASAAGDSSDPSGGIGYYVWPRFGYSGTMSTAQIAKLPVEIRSSLKGKRDVRDLFDLPGGAEAWKKHGSSLKVTFDLSPGSRNLRALEEYRRERAAKPSVRNEELEMVNEHPTPQINVPSAQLYALLERVDELSVTEGVDSDLYQETYAKLVAKQREYDTLEDVNDGI